MEEQANPPVEDQQPSEENDGEQIKGALDAFAESPSKEQIEGWKQQYGEVFCSGFSESELLIWRPISRGEFVQMQTQLAQAEQPVSQFDLEAQIVQMCTLWASEPAKLSLNQKAGSLSTVHEQIMMNSNFMDPRVAAALVVRL